ncbi:MAG TPA: nucleotidyltransferase family protein [Micromonosporaceae bacterium]
MVLAAGAGRRIGGAKALLRHGNALLVERAAGTLHEAGCDPVVVVLGAQAALVQATAELNGAQVVVNRAWGSGMGSSLRAGLGALADTGAEAVVVVLVDMPGVTAAAVRRVAALPYPQVLVCATYGGRRDHPMMLGREHWPGIATLANADVGARPYLMAHATEILEVACDDIADGVDIDTADVAADWGIAIPAQRAAV